MVVMVGGIAVARTGRWVCVLDCAEEVHCSRCPLFALNQGRSNERARIPTVGAILTAAMLGGMEWSEVQNEDWESFWSSEYHFWSSGFVASARQTAFE